MGNGSPRQSTRVLSNLAYRQSRGTRSALARLRRYEVMLQLLEDDRGVILGEGAKVTVACLYVISEAALISTMIIRFRGFA